MRAWRLFVLVLVGCGGGSGPVEGDCADVFVPLGDGESASFCVNAALGGSVSGPDGIELVVPPGALATDTTLSIETLIESDNGARTYALGPEGTVFSSPVSIRIPLGDDELIEVTHVSRGYEPMDVGSELSVMRDLPITFDGDVAIVEVDRFSLLGIFPIQEAAYLVFDIPDSDLRPGDVLVTLTQQDDGDQNWSPGHVGMVSHTPDPAEATSINADQIEATPPMVRRQTVRFFESSDGHLPLGVRRPPGSDLTDAERMTMTTFLEGALGTPYAILADIETGEGEFSCVSLVELALDSANRGVLNWFEERAYATPHDIYEATQPVLLVEPRANEELELPMYGVIRDTGIAEFVSSYVVDPMRTPITMSDAPEGATLMPERLAGIGDGTVMGQVFRWTPELPQSIDAFVYVPFSMDWSFPFRGRMISGTIEHTMLIHPEGGASTTMMYPLTHPAATSRTRVVFNTVDVPDASIREAYVFDEATGEGIPTTPFPMHVLNWEVEGRLPDGRYAVTWTLEWTVPPEDRPATIDAEPIAARTALDFDRARFRN